MSIYNIPCPLWEIKHFQRKDMVIMSKEEYAKEERELICRYIEKIDRLDLLRFICRMAMNLADNGKKGGVVV